MTYTSDTIAAIATPEGHGALGVVRVTGPDAWPLAGALTGDADFADSEPRRALLRRLYDGEGALLDEAVILPWRGPHSSTGEDLVEFICHGGPEILRMVLRRALILGARPAEPGEFTRRAFLHGKLTLDQAEGVAAAIDARTEAAARASLRVLSGGLDDRIASLRDEIMNLLSLVELSIDFVEDDVDPMAADETARRLDRLLAVLDQLRGQYDAGQRLRRGAWVVIAGAPNAGKSTLLNRFAGYERAIVSEVPGTTRDYLEVELDWGGVPVRLVDTAGLREALDDIEAEGTRRARDLLARADIILWLTDSAGPVPPPNGLREDPRLIVAANKTDLHPPAGSSVPPDGTLRISARTGEGIEALRTLAVERLLLGHDPSELVVLEERHRRGLDECRAAVEAAHRIATRGEGDELVASELHRGLLALRELTGEVTREDLLNRIFAGFCIGK